MQFLTASAMTWAAQLVTSSVRLIDSDADSSMPVPNPVPLALERTHRGAADMAAKKKTGHVVLSKETVQKLLQTSDESPQPTMMSPWDLLQLERSENAVRRAQSALELAMAEETSRRFALELTTMRMAQAMAEAKEAVRVQADAHRKVAAEMADRYNFSWSTHSYNPETGEVLETPPEP